MFSYNLKIIFRGFKKNSLFSLINIFGLAVGLAVCFLIVLYVSHELSFDQFHKNNERVYRIERDPFCTLAPSFVPLLEKDFPEFEHISRVVYPDVKYKCKVGDTDFFEKSLCWAEGDIFNVLTWSLITGDAQTALQDPGSLVISEKTAKKFYGDEIPLNKQIEVEGNVYKITGIMKIIPGNSHFNPDILISYKTLKGAGRINNDDYFLGSTNFSDNVCLTYALLSENADPKKIRSKFPGFVDKYLDGYTNDRDEHVPASSYTNLTLRKVSDIHLHSHKSNEVQVNSDISYVRLFSIIAFFVLFIACINFVNLTTAKSGKRSIEMGIKKVLGIKKKTLLSQLITENLLHIFMALILSFTIVLLAYPVFSGFLGFHDTAPLFSGKFFFLTFVAIIVLLGLFTAVIPSVLLSKSNPVEILKNRTIKAGSNFSFRGKLVVFQFIITLVLFISIGIVYSQMRFLNNKNLGFDKENVVMLPMNSVLSEKWDDVKSRFHAHPCIVSATISKRSPTGRLLDAPGFRVFLNGQWISCDRSVPHNRVDWDFFKTYGIDIIAGRDFNKDIQSDNGSSFILNKEALSCFGIDDPDKIIGAKAQGRDREGTIIGVVKNFHYESLHHRITPMVSYVSTGEANIISVRIASGNVKESVSHLKGILKDFVPNYDFEISFLDDKVAGQYLHERRMMEIIGYFSLLAVIIACLGLFGLAVHAAGQRTKEIGVRKVNGATITRILLMLNTDFVKWVAIAFVIACPLAWYAMQRWLENFAYKTEICWWIFALAGLIALAIALVTVSWQSWRAARRNPVEALRYE